MIEPWRLLVLAAVLNATVGIGVATAQSVIVRNAPPGSTIELVLNAARIGSATADPSGEVTLGVNLPANVDETDVHIYVDTCAKLQRVLLVEHGLQPPPPAQACTRTGMVRLFAVRRASTLVVDLAGPSPAVWLAQGPAPREWLRQGPVTERAWKPLPTGLVLFGGGGFAKFSDAVALACGTVSPCTGNDSRVTYAVGAAYWFTRFLAAEATYVKPANVTANGSGDTFRFDSSLDARVLTVTGMVGVPLGPVRLYGQAGANYHRATSSTTETIDDVTVTLDDVTETIPGGTQTFEMKTAGWGWLFGGGLEAWVVPSLAIYAEAGRAALKGAARDGGEGAIDDRVTFMLIGARVHIGR